MVESPEKVDPASGVYVVDGDGRLASGIEWLLRIYDIPADLYETAESFLSETEGHVQSRSCLLLVLSSDCERGLDQLIALREGKPELPIIVLCDTPELGLRKQYIDSGAADVVSKSMVDAYVFTRLSLLCPDAKNIPLTKPSTITARNGEVITIRMICPEDEGIEQQFVRALSDQSRYLRFFSGLYELPQHMLRTLTDPQFPISYALIATIQRPGGEQQIGVARYAPTKEKQVAEFAVVVADEWQNMGIASELMRCILAAANVAGLHRLEGLILRTNKSMLNLAEKFGFVRCKGDESDYSVVRVVKNLR